MNVALVLVIFAVFVHGRETIFSETECPRNYWHFSRNHTACILKSATPNGGVDWKTMREIDRKLIVDKHNFYRGRVQDYNGGYPAADMLTMSYDRELENLAQIWAANCMFSHDEANNRYVIGKYNTGQNVGVGFDSWDAVLNNWHSESKDFKYGSSPEVDRVVGHYTQMVWAETTKVGCGVQRCNDSKLLYVCNYAPVGNIAEKLYSPYRTAAVSGEGCPKTFNKTSGLCDCNQKVCYNGGILNPSSCTCLCPKATWFQDEDCAIKCTSAKDLPMCKTWGPSYCDRFVNVKVEYCPYMCKVCIDKSILTPPLYSTASTSTLKPNISPVSDLVTAEQTKRVAGQGKTTTVYGISIAYVSVRVSAYCDKEEPALCGQPNSRTGYLNRSICNNAETRAVCPAMCNICLAQSCRDYNDISYNVGESWITMYGRFTCTSEGVKLEKGCQSPERTDIIPLNDSQIMHQGEQTFSCKCVIESENSYRLVCTQRSRSSLTKLEPCTRIDESRCGLPRNNGRYWLKSHCRLHIVRKICPAMCRQCSAVKCRTYTNKLYDLDSRIQVSDDVIYVCSANGWVPGPTIVVDGPSSLNNNFSGSESDWTSFPEKTTKLYTINGESSEYEDEYADDYIEYSQKEENPEAFKLGSAARKGDKTTADRMRLSSTTAGNGPSQTTAGNTQSSPTSLRASTKIITEFEEEYPFSGRGDDEDEESSGFSSSGPTSDPVNHKTTAEGKFSVLQTSASTIISSADLRPTSTKTTSKPKPFTESSLLKTSKTVTHSLLGASTTNHVIPSSAITISYIDRTVGLSQPSTIFSTANAASIVTSTTESTVSLSQPNNLPSTPQTGRTVTISQPDTVPSTLLTEHTFTVRQPTTVPSTPLTEHTVTVRQPNTLPSTPLTEHTVTVRQPTITASTPLTEHTVTVRQPSITASTHRTHPPAQFILTTLSEALNSNSVKATFSKATPLESTTVPTSPTQRTVTPTTEKLLLNRLSTISSTERSHLRTGSKFTQSTKIPSTTKLPRFVLQTGPVSKFPRQETTQVQSLTTVSPKATTEKSQIFLTRSAGSLQANIELVNRLYPNRSAPCRLPDPAYCNQPLAGNSSQVFTKADCSLNPLVCPGMCQLCKVLQCQDYSHQIYGIGEVWYSPYARLMCTSSGVDAERGCYYEFLRTFIKAGETLQQIDGFLSHRCSCNVSLEFGVWSHVLQCERETHTEKRVTVAPTNGHCAKPDDHRCSDPYYTPIDCSSIHVETICMAMCGKCIAKKCKDSSGQEYDVGQSWITNVGKVLCTEKGLKTVRGCKFPQQNTFVEVNSEYRYTSDGTEYTCVCTKASEYRYQLACEGLKRKTNAIQASTTAPAVVSPTVGDETISTQDKCIRADNPRCGQMSADFWNKSFCNHAAQSWRLFMKRACPALCGFCTAVNCRGYDGRDYKIGETWKINSILHRCTERGIEF